MKKDEPTSEKYVNKLLFNFSNICYNESFMKHGMVLITFFVMEIFILGRNHFAL